jgi:dolichol-phosphate mannosyltransferase
MNPKKERELILVMPVYNEAECIVPVINEWRDELSRLKIDFEMIVLNDGSKDETAQVLEIFTDDERIKIINKANSGHGPTILKGYREAVERAEWVFQVDSDDEMKPASFHELWSRRADYDGLFGFRHNREQESARKFLSGGSRVVIRLLFEGGVKDVNTPYRLLRSEVLMPIVAAIPDDTFAPNIIISGVLSKQKKRIFNFPVPHEGRKTGTISLTNSKVWKVALKSFRQTLMFRMPK